MPSLRNKSNNSQGSQDQTSSLNTNQADKETSNSCALAKVRADEPESLDGRPASPRRLRDRRLLSGFKQDAASINHQSANSPVKSSSQKNDVNHQPIATTNQNELDCPQPTAKRPHPPITPSEQQQTPRSSVKRAASRAESLLAKLQPDTSVADPIAKSNSASPSKTVHDSRPTKGSSLLAPPLKNSDNKNATSSSDRKATKDNIPNLTYVPSKATGIRDQQKHKNNSSDSNTNNGKQSNKNSFSRDISESINATLAKAIALLPVSHGSTSITHSVHSQPLLNSGSKSTLSASNLTESARRSIDSFEDAGISFDQSGAINMSKKVARDRTFNVLIAVTGSVAAIKLTELIRKLRSAFPQTYTCRNDNQTYKATIAIKVVMTESSKHFVPQEELTKLSNSLRFEVLHDSDEWAQWTKIGDPVLHIELRKWADLCLIAPLDANTMAKLSHGQCDNLLTCTVRAWDMSKPLIYCPAMNVHMYNHPITQEHLNTLQSFGYQRVDCVEKRLACGDVGLGAMAATDTIVNRVVESLIKPPVRFRSYSNVQQSMYPTSSTSSLDLIERIKAASQRNTITIHGTGGSNRPLDLGSPGVSATSLARKNGNQLSSLFRHHILPDDDQHLLDDHDDIELFHDGQLSNCRISNMVTSLQNLKAIDARSPVIGDGSDFEEQDDVANDDQIHNDTDEAIAQAFVSGSSGGDAPQLVPPPLPANGLSTKHNNCKSKPQSADPSAYISHCYNKNRNCFTCIICKNDYKNRKSMSRHLKEQHLQGNIHRCSPCGVSYKRREKLIKHNREHHSN